MEEGGSIYYTKIEVGGRREKEGNSSLSLEMEEGGSIYYTKIEVGGRREKEGNSSLR
jgi:hypothetical protein